MPTPQRIVLLGSGRVATHLARALDSAEGYNLVQIYSRVRAHAERLRLGLDSPTDVVDTIAELDTTADYYIFAVTDEALPQLWEQMPTTSGIWLHTSGGTTLEAMCQHHADSGVLYPLQTFSLERPIVWADVPIYIEGSSPTVLECVRHLAERLSPQVSLATSGQRLALHIGAVLACNFANHLVALGQEWLRHNGLPPDSLRPLLAETCDKLAHLPAREAQTGPACRGDLATIERHCAMLRTTQPELEPLYRLLSESIRHMYHTPEQPTPHH